MKKYFYLFALVCACHAYSFAQHKPGKLYGMEKNLINADQIENSLKPQKYIVIEDDDNVDAKQKTTPTKSRPNNDKDELEEKIERDKWFAKRHLNDDGTVGNIEQLQKAHSEIAQIPFNIATTDLVTSGSNDPNWKPVGPAGTPMNTLDPYQGIVGSGRVNTIALNKWNQNNIWIGTPSGGIFKSWTHGASWINVSLPLPTPEITDIAIDPYNDNMIYVATGDWDAKGFFTAANALERRTTKNGIFKTTDGGSTWFRLNVPQVDTSAGGSQYASRIIVNQKENAQVLVTGDAGIFKSYDSGNSWKKVSPLHCTDLQAAPSDPNTVYAVSNIFRFNSPGSYVIKSTNFGETWDTLKNLKLEFRADSIYDLEYNARLAIANDDANKVYLLTGRLHENFVNPNNSFSYDDDYGMAYLRRTTDGGKTWTIQYNARKSRNLFGWVMGGFDDLSGQTWYAMSLALDSKNSDRVFVGGVDLWGSANGGVEFAKVSHWNLEMGPSAHADHHTAKFHPLTNEGFFGTDGGLYSSKNIIVDKLANQVVCEKIDSFPYQIDSATIVFIPYTYIDFGCYKLKTPFTDINGNVNNTEIYNIAVPTQVPNVVVEGAQDNGTSMYLNGSWTQILGGDGMVPLIHPSNMKIRYASNYNGTMSKTNDGGLNWRFGVTDTVNSLDPGPWVTRYSMSPKKPEDILTARADVWRTLDSMKTWNKISDFTNPKTFRDNYQASWVGFAPSNTDHIWVAKYYLYKTTDGGKNWNYIATPFRGYNVSSFAISPTNPNVVFVTTFGFTANSKVFVTRDGGKTWKNISGSIPNTPVNTVVIDAQSDNEAVYVGTDIGVFYTNNTMSDWMPYNLQLPVVIVNDLQIQPQERQLYAGTYGRGVYKSQLRDNVSATLAPQAFASTEHLSSQLNVYPNPSKGTLLVAFSDKITQAESIEIIDLYGRSLLKKTNFTGAENLDLKGFSNGTYFVKMQTTDGIVSKKFILDK